MKPILVIDDFKQGILDDPTIQARDGFAFSQGLDIHTQPGILQVREKVEAMSEKAATDDITDLILWMRNYGDVIYGLGSGGSNRIYDYNNTEAGKWALVHDDANTGWGQGMVVYGGNLYWASNTALGKFTGSVWTDSFQTLDEDTAWHPMVVFMGKLMIGAGRYIAVWDGTTFTQQALVLPPGYKVKSLEVYGDRLMIGTWKGANIYEYKEAILFTWDGDFGHTYEQAINIKESGINSMRVWNNLLYMACGIVGNIYTFNGAIVEKAVQIPGDYSGGNWGYVNPDAMQVHSGNLVIGVSGGAATVRGIYTLGRKNSKYPIALTSDYLVNEGALTGAGIGSILSISTNALYFSRIYNSAYGVDNLNQSRRTSVAFKETQIYEVPKGNQSRLIKAIELVLKPLQTSNTITIKYKIDNESSWQTLDTITSSNQSAHLSLLKRAKVIQFRLEFAVSTLNYNSPELSKILVY